MLSGIEDEEMELTVTSEVFRLLQTEFLGPSLPFSNRRQSGIFQLRFGFGEIGDGDLVAGLEQRRVTSLRRCFPGKQTTSRTLISLEAT